MFRLNHNKLRNILRLYQKCTIFYVAIVGKLYKRSKRLQNGNKMVTICCRFVTTCDILSTDGKEMLSFMTERKATLKVWGGLDVKSNMVYTLCKHMVYMLSITNEHKK